MRKTEAKPGKPAVMKLRLDEEQLIIDWINAQTVYGDSMRYLIQKDIAEHGIRNLQLHVPSMRDIETIRVQLRQEQSGVTYQHHSSLNQLSSTERTTKDHRISSDTIDVNAPSASVIAEIKNDPVFIAHPTEIKTHEVVTDDEKSQPVLRETQNIKRPSGKKFDSSVVDSYQ
jgi:phosphoenolpyruvate carboxylase